MVTPLLQNEAGTMNAIDGYPAHGCFIYLAASGGERAGSERIANELFQNKGGCLPCSERGRAGGLAVSGGERVGGLGTPTILKMCHEHRIAV